MLTSRLMPTAVLAAMTVLLGACATAPATLNYYDFGAAPKPSESNCALPPIYLADIASPNALDSNLMIYRLLYANEQESHAYANSRWNMTPAQILALRFKAQFADSQVTLLDNGVANPNGWQLRLDLSDFGQYFIDATHSYAQLTLRASLLRGSALIGQTTIKHQAAADSADASGGARAMRAASDASFTELSNWLCKQAKP